MLNKISINNILYIPNVHIFVKKKKGMQNSNGFLKKKKTCLLLYNSLILIKRTLILELS